VVIEDGCRSIDLQGSVAATHASLRKLGVASVKADAIRA
jgi:hypothetical protein